MRTELFTCLFCDKKAQVIVPLEMIQSPSEISKLHLLPFFKIQCDFLPPIFIVVALCEEYSWI